MGHQKQAHLHGGLQERDLYNGWDGGADPVRGIVIEQIQGEWLRAHHPVHHWIWDALDS